MGEHKSQRIPDPLFVVLLFLAFSLLYALFTPVWETPDEPAHYLRIRKLAEGDDFDRPRYPGPFRTVWSEFYLYSSYQASQPPLYYLAAGATLKGLNLVLPPPSGRIIFPPVRADRETAGKVFLHPELPRRALLSGAASVYCLRFFSVFLGGLTVILIYKIARTAWPGEPTVALGAAGFAATLPQFNFISGAIGNDPAAALLGAGTLLYLVSRLSRDRPAGARYYLGLGALLALGLLVKLNLVFLLPTAVVFILLKRIPLPLPPPPGGEGVTWCGKPPSGRVASAGNRPGGDKAVGRGAASGFPPGWRGTAAALLLTFAPLFLIGAASALLFPGEFAWKVRVLRARLFQFTPEMLTGVEFRHMFGAIYRSFFALFGWMSIPVSGWLYLAWGLLGAFALAGWFRRPSGRIGRRGVSLGRPGGLLAAAAVILLVGVIKNNLLVPQSQGRFLFPALGAIAALFSAGFCRHFPRALRRRAVRTLLVLLAVLNLIAFFEFLGRIS